MSVTSTPIFPQTIQSTCTQLTHSTSTSVPTTIYTAGANGTRIEKITATNTDTNAYTITFSLKVSSTNYTLATVSVPLSAGNTTAVVPFDVFNNSNFASLAVDSDNNKYLYLANGTTLQVLPGGTITTSQVVNFIVQAGDY